MILEALITTLDEAGAVNLAPMGPIVEDDDLHLRRFTLRPYQTSTTYRNLKATGEGVLHVTDDVLLIARAAINRLDLAQVPMRLAGHVRGLVLVDCCRYHEFRVVDLDDREARTTILAETAATARVRDWFGFNRARHAVLEAAILASRIGVLPMTEILAEFDRLAVPVAKTAGRREHEAFALLRDHVESHRKAEVPPR